MGSSRLNPLPIPLVDSSPEQAILDVSGYAIAEITCDGTDTVKGIPVDTCSASVEPTKRSIQANLLETYSLLDATPGALPVYFGSEISLMAEQLSGLIISENQLQPSTWIHGLIPIFQVSLPWNTWYLYSKSNPLQ